MKKKIGLTILWLVLMIPFVIVLVRQIGNHFMGLMNLNIFKIWDRIVTVSITVLTPFIGIGLCIYLIVRTWLITPKQRLLLEENKKIKAERRSRQEKEKAQREIEKKKREIEDLENRLN